MLKISIDTSDLQRKLAEAGRRLDDPTDVLNDLGIYLMAEVQLDFEALSRRKPAPSDGRQWKELTEAREWQKSKRNRKGPKSKTQAKKQADRKSKKTGTTADHSSIRPPQSQIGVDVGRLRNSATPGIQSPDQTFVVDAAQGSVTVGFNVSYAAAFDKLRPLIPNETPAEWQTGAEQVVQTWLDDVLKPLDDG